nr:hypothetical protein [Tanacetum cinerariifolium]
GCLVTILNTLDHLGNQTNGNAGTKANIDAGQADKKIVSSLQYVLLPLLNIDSQGPKSLEDKVADDVRKQSTKVLRNENEVQDPAKQGDKNDQQKDVSDQEEAPRNQHKQTSKRLFGQGDATNTNNTNRLNTISSPVNDVSSSFTIVDPGRERAQRNEFESVFRQDNDANDNMMLTPAAGSTYVYLGGSIPFNVATLPNVNLPIDPLMLNLEDTIDTGIFDDVYNDREVGAEANINNLELSIVEEKEHKGMSLKVYPLPVGTSAAPLAKTIAASIEVRTVAISSVSSLVLSAAASSSSKLLPLIGASSPDPSASNPCLSSRSLSLTVNLVISIP